MESPVHAHNENRRLRRTMRDLVALSTLPAVWINLAPDAIARSLADVILSTLCLDFVYVRLKERQWARVDRSGSQQPQLAAAEEIVQAAVRELLHRPCRVPRFDSRSLRGRDG